MILPNELVAEIFCYTGVSTLIKCSQVNYCWTGLSKIRYVWKYKHVRGKKKIRDRHLKGIAHISGLSLRECGDVRNVSILGNVHTLDLSDTKISDISALGNIHRLSLAQCNRIKDVSISALKRVHTLTLNLTDTTDVSSLGHLYRLEIWHCKNLKNVSALGNLHHLSLWGCWSVTDVSALGNVRNLDLGKCKFLKDVSALGNQYYLEILRTSVTDFNGLERIKKLVYPSGKTSSTYDF